MRTKFSPEELRHQNSLIKKLMRENPDMTTADVAGEIGITWDMAYSRLRRMGIRPAPDPKNGRNNEGKSSRHWANCTHVRSQREALRTNEEAWRDFMLFGPARPFTGWQHPAVTHDPRPGGISN